ncbi:MAG: DUF3105 domain-containing protein [Rubrobacteraceae bacterium]|nr:DUF3105 domain-containing protein [Rubrobacteraceae bacterium]
MSAGSPRREFGESLSGKKPAVVILLVTIVLLVAACGGKGSDNSSNDPGKQEASGTQDQGATSAASSEKSVVEETTAGKTGPSGEAAELAKAEVGKREITNMIPADRKKPDAARPLPENPPNGIEVYPATTNRIVEGPIHYDRRPPTNGNHDPLWQNCGFYEQPIEDRHAVHSLDHGVVWITYHPDLPEQQVRSLRPYSKENYVILSPYPGQDAPVTATSWRVQLELNSADDPRLRRFVNQFRISELAPLSGNRCTLGVGKPKE